MIQFLYRKKDQFNAKLRRRKFKLKVLNKSPVRNSSYNKTISPHPWLFSLRVKHACRLKFKSLIGSQRAIMATKNKVRLHFDKYPNFFVTKKSSKSRMGKGKGKIAGRVLRVQKGERIFSAFLADPKKTKRWLKAIKGTIPSKTTLVPSSWGAKRFYENYYRSFTYIKFRAKRKKKPFWVKVVKKFWPRYHEVVKYRSKEFDSELYCLAILNGYPEYRKRGFNHKYWRFFPEKMLNRFARRRFRHNYLGDNTNGTESCLDEVKYNPGLTTGHYSYNKFYRKLPTCRRKSFYLKKITMVYVIKNLRLDVLLPDAQGYTGMARHMNLMNPRAFFLHAARRRKRLADIAAGRPTRYYEEF